MNQTDDVIIPLSEARKGVFINHEQMKMIEHAYIGIAFIITVIGLITNGLNIKTFGLMIGKKDGVTVSLLSLSISDFGFCLSSLVLVLGYALTKLEARHGSFVFQVDPWIISMFAASTGYAFYATTTLTTTFLAVARCMCVARPLQFSHTFTKSRAIVIHTCFAVISIGAYIPIMSQMGGKRTVNAVTNQTRYVAWKSDMREAIKDVVFLIFDTILTFTSQIVLIICLFIMAKSLSRAGQFRQSAKANVSENGEGKEEQSYKMSGKELQVIQQVVLISSMCVVCALPKIFSSSYGLVEPQYAMGKRLHNIYLTASHLRKVLELINSSSTFFIHYKYNSRFKELHIGASK